MGSGIYFGLFTLFVFFTIGSVDSNPQFSNDDIFKNRPSSFDDPDWFKKKQEEQRRDSEQMSRDFDQRRDQMSRDFDQKRDENMKIFWIVAGVMICVFVLVVICGACCFFIPACLLAKTVANRRSRSTGYAVPHNQATTGGVGGYPMQPTGYPYAQNNLSQQQQPFVPPGGGYPSAPPKTGYPEGAVPYGEKNGYNQNQSGFNPYPPAGNPPFPYPPQSGYPNSAPYPT